MNRSTELKFRQLLVVVGCWVGMGFFIAVYDHLLIHTDSALGPSPQYSFGLAAARNMIAGCIGGLLGGSFLVFYVNVRYQDKPYGYTIVAVSVAYLLILAFVTLVLGAILVPLRTGAPLGSPVSQAAFRDFIRDPYPRKSGLVWFFIVVITQLLLQVTGKFGQTEFWNIIRGKYNKPREERRIFMFLDLNSSTAIAEQLGDETYHALLKDFFSDLTSPILDSKGHIYQYVGDEVVVAWNYDEGREEAHCIRCFFDMKRRMEKNRNKYLERYGLVPSFKAGLHCGRVIAGEVGIVKRDITYSGDVLNTTSRILNKCGELHEEILASSDLLEQVPAVAAYRTRPLGAMKLKGKEREVGLHAVGEMGEE